MNLTSWKTWLPFLIISVLLVLVYIGSQYAMRPTIQWRAFGTNYADNSSSISISKSDIFTNAEGNQSLRNLSQSSNDSSCVHKCETSYADSRIYCVVNAACLANIIREKCMDENRVPNVVHYVWFGSRELAFHHMISMMATVKYIKPCHIMIHGDAVPYGKWWDFMLSSVNASIFMHIPRKPPTSIFGHPISVIEHQSDVARLEILNKFGGIYLDTDYIPVRSFTPLRKYNLTLGRESDHALCNGVIVAAPGSKFINIWYDSYETFNDREWGTSSVVKPHALAKEYPQWIHIEETGLHRPNFMEIDEIYKMVINFEKKYGIHLWFRFYNVHHNTDDVKKLNSTYGLLCRMVLYNTTNLMER